MANGAADRFGPRATDSEIERLCAYLKNDSIIRWKLDCAQADIDAARARLAGRNPIGNGQNYYPGGFDGRGRDEEKQRERRAIAGSKAYLKALARVAKC